MDTQEVGSEQRSARAERVAFYHPNASGTGTAVRIDPKMNGGTASPRNGFFLELAQQKSAATRNADGFVPASFDWEGKITVKLGFQDVFRQRRQHDVGGPFFLRSSQHCRQ